MEPGSGRRAVSRSLKIATKAAAEVPMSQKAGASPLPVTVTSASIMKAAVPPNSATAIL